MNSLRISGYAHLQYYHNLILQIFDLCHKLESLAISIKIIKIKAHSNNEFNDKVDKMAKNACNRAVIWKKTNHINWHEEFTPAIVSIANFNEVISLKFDKINYQKWKKRGKIIKHRINDRKMDDSISDRMNALLTKRKTHTCAVLLMQRATRVKRSARCDYCAAARCNVRFFLILNTVNLSIYCHCSVCY